MYMHWERFLRFSSSSRCFLLRRSMDDANCFVSFDISSSESGSSFFFFPPDPPSPPLIPRLPPEDIPWSPSTAACPIGFFVRVSDIQRYPRYNKATAMMPPSSIRYPVRAHSTMWATSVEHAAAGWTRNMIAPLHGHRHEGSPSRGLISFELQCEHSPVSGSARFRQRVLAKVLVPSHLGHAQRGRRSLAGYNCSDCGRCLSNSFLASCLVSGSALIVSLEV